MDKIQQDTSNSPLTPEQVAKEKAAAAAGEAVTINGGVHNNGDVVAQEGDLSVKPTQPTAELASARPEHVPEKFWNAETKEVNVEALLKAQADAQAELTKLQQGGKSEQTPEEIAAAEKAAAEGEPATETKAVSTARDEYAEKGELSEDTYKALEAEGITKEMVDQYIAGQEYKVNELTTAAYNAVGGEEQFTTMSKWASENLDPTDVATLNTLLTSSDPAVVANGAKQLADVYAKEADIQPKTILGGKVVTNKSGYGSSAEMRADMGSKQYKTDAAFRAKVDAKLEATDNRILFG